MNQFVFPCTQCGACCKHIAACQELEELNIGNGCCRHLKHNKCEIYQTRPNVCRADYIYQRLFADRLDIKAFHDEMLKICKKLQEIHNEN